MNEYRVPSPPSFLRVIFPPPGFFLADTTVALMVNAHLVWQGSFKQGFDWWAEVPPGMHVVSTSIAAPLGMARQKAYSIEVRPALTTIATLEYSRMWGNFTSSPARVDFVTR